ncbi:unnamed protein product [Arabis nemorensis]|uniref:Uncharacterized protein n=1 Tax=Arabis nemorensis TaxID=586526 RepID=A0A565B6J4_9BRAS|nr:unnamed protein product [Arabis nemorensis]
MDSGALRYVADSKLVLSIAPQDPMILTPAMRSVVLLTIPQAPKPPVPPDSPDLSTASPSQLSSLPHHEDCSSPLLVKGIRSFWSPVKKIRRSLSLHLVHSDFESMGFAQFVCQSSKIVTTREPSPSINPPCISFLAVARKLSVCLTGKSPPLLQSVSSSPLGDLLGLVVEDTIEGLAHGVSLGDFKSITMLSCVRSLVPDEDIEPPSQIKERSLRIGVPGGY